MNQMTVVAPYSDVAALTADIRELIKATCGNYISIGGKLATVKNALGHGQFGPWLKAEFGWSERTAQRFMYVAKWSAGKDVNFSRLGFNALYLLAAPSTPQSVQDEILRKIASGENVSAAEIAAACKAAKAPRKPRTPRDRTRRQVEKIAAVVELTGLVRQSLGADLPRFIALLKKSGSQHLIENLRSQRSEEL